jgi:aminopeptidase-like protein
MNATGEEIFGWISELFPQSRSVVGPGIDSALNFIESRVPSNVQTSKLKFKSGKKVGDWTVPDAWKLNRAYISDTNGKILIDSKDSNLHLWSHSRPFSGIISHIDLMEHIRVGEPGTENIPYLTTYYRDNWGFSINSNQALLLDQEEYQVLVDTEITPGELQVLEFVIPGKYKNEVLFSSYICHPSMANNELSGPTLMLAIIRELASRKLNYTYRFVIGPETIGAICYLSKKRRVLQKRTWAGLNLTCVGGRDEWSYLQTPGGLEQIDLIIRKTFACMKIGYKEFGFLNRGSDERQYSSPLIGIPMASVMRSKYHEYPEYHTSGDNLSFISPLNLQESLDFYRRLITLIDNEGRFTSTNLGEPFISKWFDSSGVGGLHPRDIDTKRTMISNIIAYSKQRTLIEVAESIGECPHGIINYVNELTELGLLKKTPLSGEF